MGIHIVRYGTTQWGRLENGYVTAIEGTYPTLREFLFEGAGAAAAADAQGGRPVGELQLESPVTEPCRIICQGLNYRDHMIETGRDPDKQDFNMIFTKASSSLNGPTDPVLRPNHVRLLDYELELGLVVGKDIGKAEAITEENLHEYVAGIVIGNDVSARDVQLKQRQFFKAKSYRTFCPIGSVLYLIEAEDVPKIHDLELRLWVNDELRQESNTENLLFRPAQTLKELSEIMDLSAGDLILTGTPAGVAVTSPPDGGGAEEFFAYQLTNPAFLNDGDVIRGTIRSADGSIDLGEHRNTIQPA